MGFPLRFTCSATPRSARRRSRAAPPRGWRARRSSSACRDRRAPAATAGTAFLPPSSITARGPAILWRSCRAWTNICAARRRKGRRPKFRHSGARPTGPRQARPDERAPGISRFRVRRFASPRNDEEKKSQLPFPGLADQALPKTAVRLGGDLDETGILVDLAGGDQDALGPQRDFAIAAGLRESDAFGDQPFAQSTAATGRIDQQQPQLGDIVGVLDEKYRADRGAIEVGDPAAFPRRIERGEEFGRDLRHQALERGVEAVFAGIE